MEEIALAVGSGDDAQFFYATVQRVGDAGEDRLPDGFGIVMKGKFGEDNIGGITANGLGPGGERGDARTVWETEFGGAVGGGGLRVTPLCKDRVETIGPVFG